MTTNHRVLKRGLELLITEKLPVDRSDIRRAVERETVRVTAERVNEAIRYSESSVERRWYQIYSDDFDLTHLTPGEKSAGKIFARYSTQGNQSIRFTKGVYKGVTLEHRERRLKMIEEKTQETPENEHEYEKPTNTGDHREVVEEDQGEGGENNND